MASGHVEKRGKRGWTTVVVEHDPNPATGQRKREKFTIKTPPKTYLTKEQAEGVLYARLVALNAGTYIAPSPVTLAVFLERWFAERCKGRALAPATLSNYALSIRYLKEAFGGLTLDKLQPGYLEAAYGRLLSEGRTAPTIHRMHVVLHTALAYAVKLQLVPRNVADSADAPVVKTREITVLTPEEASRLLTVARKYAVGGIIALALHTGLRRGELLGLQWRDIDLEGGFLRVSRILQHIDGRTILKAPKTEKSRREVGLDEEAVALLRSIRERNPQHEFVFCKKDGSPYNPTYVSRKAGEIARRAGFPMRLHDQRHAFATLGLAAHVEAKVMQEILGHKDISTTLDTYTHVLRQLKKDAAQAIGDALKNARHQLGTKSDSAGETKEAGKQADKPGSV
jgi:integrase